jgi:hypothetical protein
VRSPRGWVKMELNLPDKELVMSPNNVSNVSQSLQEATDAPGEAGLANDQDHGSGASGRMDESAGLHSSPDAKRVDTPVTETVHTSEPALSPQQLFRSGELVSTRGGIKTAAEAAEMAGSPRQFTGQTYGKVNAQQGRHMPAPTSTYTCIDCQHLEARIRKAFKEQGVEF